MEQAFADASGDDLAERAAVRRADDDRQRTLLLGDLLKAAGDGDAWHRSQRRPDPRERAYGPLQGCLGLVCQRCRMGAGGHDGGAAVERIDGDEDQPRARSERERARERQCVSGAFGALDADDDRAGG